MSTLLMTAGQERKDGLTNELLSRLKALISRGVLLPGAKLPPERELAQRFGVSRSSLRHAFKALEIMGVLTQRVGDGTYLNSDAVGVLCEPLELLFLLDGISLDDLLETRLIVEPELAARAAERAMLEDVEKMRASLAIMQGERDETKLIESDLAFHQAIFHAARNRVCNRIFTLIHRAMMTSIAMTSKVVDWNHTLSFHWPIYDAIEKRRPSEARQRMIEHLLDAQELLGRIQAGKKRLDPAAVIRPVAQRRRGHRDGRSRNSY